MKKLVLAAKAERDVQDCYLFIAQDNVEAADRVIAELNTAMDQLIIYPKLGRVGIGRGTRELIVTPYIVTYRIENHVIHVLDVVHGSRRK